MLMCNMYAAVPKITVAVYYVQAWLPRFRLQAPMPS